MEPIKSAEWPRRKPSKLAQQLVLLIQANRCFYCGTVFGEMFWQKTKLKVASIHWDHVLPYCYSFNSDTENFVASCCQCNQIKASKIFDTYDDAKKYIIAKRQARGLPVYRVRKPILKKEDVAKILQREVSNIELLEISRDREEAARAIKIIIKCAHCGQELTMTRKWKKFCSQRCQWNHWAELHPRINTFPEAELQHPHPE